MRGAVQATPAPACATLCAWCVQGVKALKLREARYAELNGEHSFRLDHPANALGEAGREALDHAIADARRPNGKLVVELELNHEQAKRCLAIAMAHDVHSNERTRKEGDLRGLPGEKYHPFDASLLARLAINGDAIPGPLFRMKIRELQEQIFAYRTQLAYERNWSNWRMGTTIFKIPLPG